MSDLNLETAIRHFEQVDPTMHRLTLLATNTKQPIELPVPRQSEQFFQAIVKSIVSQQISTKAAASVFGRVNNLLDNITPERVLAVSKEELQACGLSAQKTKYIRHNAEVWHTVPVCDFPTMSDEDVIAELTKLYGIGQWTAEMFLMFSLARPDVFSYGDLGLMQSLFAEYPLRPHWRRKIASTVEAWAPHRTTASLVLWWHRKPTQSLTTNQGN